MAISIEDVRSLAYFHQDRGDMTRYTGWEALQQDLEREFPEVLHYHRKLQRTKRALDRVVKEMLDEAEAKQPDED